MTFRHLAVALLSLALLQTGGIEPAAAATGQERVRTAKPTATKKAPVRYTIRKKTAKATTLRKAAVRKPTLRKVSARRSLVALVAPMAPVQVRPEVDRLGNPQLRSAAFVVVNQATGEVILEKKSDSILPIASITKLMTAMVVLDGGQSLSEEIVITEDDLDTIKGTGSRLALGTRLTREQLLHLALMSSENRAASALGRSYPGGIAAFVQAMNVKARLVGLGDTHFNDSTGLDPANVSSPRDLVRMVSAASTYPLIRRFSTSSEDHVEIRGRMHRFGNTNSLVRSPEWDIDVSKTGYIREAGRCLVMQARLLDQPVIIVLMDSDGRYTRTADAVRIKKWLEAVGAQRVAGLVPGGNG
ncbi:serine hydrolase [Aromatoleum bremense]|uniref:Peptidase S11 n=1 Tax=Aromatoleum bremense TaxID=76115 RepID=A0ABX1NWX0_9RHOO|nr:serine hydrolase [Aromatoleum bremense]NMG16491.1 peptidase S11 [Aromatoleum bremense]QTQ31225.1 D-alanyl-D-alanine endopeptidase [Aromatoleum bremense]